MLCCLSQLAPYLSYAALVAAIPILKYQYDQSHFTVSGNNLVNKYRVIETTQKGWFFQIFMATAERPTQLFVGPPVIVIGSYLLYVFDIIQEPWFGLFSGLIFSLIYVIYLLGVIVAITVQSYYYGEGSQGTPAEIKRQQDKYIVFKDEEFKKEWYGKKMSIEPAIEAFQKGMIDFVGPDGKPDVLGVMKARYEIFRFNITLNDVLSIISDFLARLWKHNSDADKADVSDVYNRGNDFYGWFLCSKMLYSTGLWDSSDETDFDTPSKLLPRLDTAQDKKLDKICKDLCMMKEGMEHLDLGCGWGALALHATGNYKVKTTGITLSKEQAAFIAKKDTEKRCNIRVMNAWDLDHEGEDFKKYDVITCLEMSEHIGIRDYQQFMHKVRTMLKDDGVFYLQIAGLRRNWQYEEVTWGLYMNRYIFPGADASCPLYWDVEQVERAGFEVKSIDNCGTHYGLTILAWYKNWVKNKDVVVKKYSEWAWRNWSIFLAWSHLIAMQGSSTVYMIALTKNFPNDNRSRSYPSALADLQAEKGAKADPNNNVFGISRAKLFVDKQR